MYSLHEIKVRYIKDINKDSNDKDSNDTYIRTYTYSKNKIDAIENGFLQIYQSDEFKRIQQSVIAFEFNELLIHCIRDFLNLSEEDKKTVNLTFDNINIILKDILSKSFHGNNKFLSESIKNFIIQTLQTSNQISATKIDVGKTVILD